MNSVCALSSLSSFGVRARSFSSCSNSLGSSKTFAARSIALSDLAAEAETAAEVREGYSKAETDARQALELAPDLVRPEKIAQSDDADRTAGLVFSHPVNRTSANGVTGFPSRASREAPCQRVMSMVKL